MVLGTHIIFLLIKNMFAVQGIGDQGGYKMRQRSDRIIKIELALRFYQAMFSLDVSCNTVTAAKREPCFIFYQL